MEAMSLNSFKPAGTVKSESLLGPVNTGRYPIGRVSVYRSILSSGVPVTIEYEDNNVFGFNNNRTMFGLRGEYEFNKHLGIGEPLWDYLKTIIPKSKHWEDPLIIQFDSLDYGI